VSLPSAVVEPFALDAGVLPAVRGFLHRPGEPSGDGVVLTHGAGGNANAPLLVAVAQAFAAQGFTVLRGDLPYRQARASGPPSPASAARDRQGLRHAVQAMRGLARGRLILGGVSYGGRQASLLLAEDPKLAEVLLLLSYPLHPPGQAAELRTGHFRELRTPTLFVHGTGDPFGTLDELEQARILISARNELVVVAGGHDLGASRSARTREEVAARVVQGLSQLMA
jgi:predicted alpha/beta-hydrolase family hydrolase